MTADEITEMARESQLFDFRDDLSSVPADYAGSICLFAQLVATKERERCAKACDWLKDIAEKLMEDPDYYMGQYERMGAFEDAAESIRAGIKQ